MGEDGATPDWPGSDVRRVKLSTGVFDRWRRHGGGAGGGLSRGGQGAFGPSRHRRGDLGGHPHRDPDMWRASRCVLQAGSTLGGQGISVIQGGKRDVGTTLVQHPLIRAVVFTGSLCGGRALFDLCAQRPEPIPFFGELGSVNPMFLLPKALNARCEAIARGWAGSLTMGAGQFCTNPGIAVVGTGAEGDAFIATTAEALKGVATQCMLTDGIAQAYQDGKARLDGRNAVRPVLTTDSEGRNAAPNLYETDAAHYLQDYALGEEVFGPLGLVVRVSGGDEMEVLAKGFKGQLTATLHMDKGDTALAQRLVPILERKAGRVLANGFPTGVEVCDAMVHGGPYPASTNFGETSVGTLSIRRFLRPVCYQNMPDAVLPGDLQ